ncbi:MAG: hypothetical protein IM477_10840 [Microcystis sp. M090S1]|uniref:hypothetical protein n=1 Tax=Microcystis sp. M090S1 TaxID=2771135 RepID=UPI00258D82CB|nr:hypothetical protein [Microcystis sp. M090S1]MCA2813008.1 hypothetical protein [Microcystis sp. M090S1]
MSNLMAYGTDIPLGQITNASGVINIQRNTVKVTRIQRLSDNEFLDPMLPPTGPTPPYALAPESPNSPPLTSPGPQAPTPTNPVPFGPPGATPPFVPFPRPEKNNTGGQNEPPKKEETPPWFSPFPALDPPFKEPFDFNPTDTPKTTGPYVVNDPVLDFGLNRPPNPLAHPIPIPDPAPIPATDLIPNPAPIPTTDPNPNPTNPPNRQPTTTPEPNKDKNPIPFFPPFPIVNPTNPRIETPPNNPPPVNQTPPGNSCCVATPVTQSLGDINQKSDLLLEKMIDLSLLQVINGKLGPQISGGLSGYLQDRFTKLWKSRVVDRTLNLMATAASIHNAVMLSRNIGSTLISTLGNALSIIGIKDGDEVAQNFSTVIGDGIENIVKGLIGEANYTQLSETWAKANRIYQSAINIYQLMTDSLFGITEGLEQTAKYTGKIGNALRKSGVVLENSYNWMSETFNFSSGKNRKIDRVIEGLQEASEVASDLESITSEFRSVTENVAEIGTQVNTIKTEINGKEENKKNNEDNSKNSSQSPQINKSDLTKPDN